jgi:hypothetical protein
MKASILEGREKGEYSTPFSISHIAAAISRMVMICFFILFLFLFSEDFLQFLFDVLSA